MKVAFAKLQQIIDRPTNALSDVNREEWAVIFQLVPFIPKDQRTVHDKHTKKTTRLNHMLIKIAVRISRDTNHNSGCFAKLRNAHRRKKHYRRHTRDWRCATRPTLRRRCSVTCPCLRNLDYRTCSCSWLRLHHSLSDHSRMTSSSSGIRDCHVCWKDVSSTCRYDHVYCL